MTRWWSRRPEPEKSAEPAPAASLSTVLIQAMSSFGCAFRLVFVLGSLMVVFCVCAVAILLAMKWVGLTAVLSAADPSGGTKTLIVAGTGLAAPLLATTAVLLRRTRK
jgi:hypothetical protein